MNHIPLGQSDQHVATAQDRHEVACWTGLVQFQTDGYDSRFLFALFLLAVTFAPGCIGGGVFSKERLVGRFAMWAVDGLSDNSVVEESEDRRAARVLIPPTVFAVGFNDHFIIAKRHPKSGHQIDRSTTEFFVVAVLEGQVHGPVDQGEFAALRARLGVPASLGFSRVIEQLADQSSDCVSVCERTSDPKPRAEAAS